MKVRREVREFAKNDTQVLACVTRRMVESFT